MDLMTEAVLIGLITSLCSTSSSHSSSQNPDKEQVIVCYERLTNCSVKNDGKIMDMKEFIQKCVNE